MFFNFKTDSASESITELERLTEAALRQWSNIR
jgi:hypothetical protein